MRPYTTLQMTNAVLITNSIQVGIRIFNRWFGQFCSAVSAMAKFKDFQVSNRMNRKKCG